MHKKSWRGDCGGVRFSVPVCVFVGAGGGGWGSRDNKAKRLWDIFVKYELHHPGVTATVIIMLHLFFSSQISF